MTVTFDGVELTSASKLANAYPVLVKERVLMSGKRRIRASSEKGFSAVYEFLGTIAEINVILGKTGSPYTLIDNEETHTTCYIFVDPEVKETDSPGTFSCRVTFRQATA